MEQRTDWGQVCSTPDYVAGSDLFIPRHDPSKADEGGAEPAAGAGVTGCSHPIPSELPIAACTCRRRSSWRSLGLVAAWVAAKDPEPDTRLAQWFFWNPPLVFPGDVGDDERGHRPSSSLRPERSQR